MGVAARAEQRTRAGQQAGSLLVGGGALTLVNNYLPGSGHLTVAVLDLTATAAILLGAACLVLPWARWPDRAPLALVPAAFALIAVSNVYGGVSAYSYAVYFVVVFVWVGLAQPAGTSLWLAAPAAAAYLLPFLLRPDPPPHAASSVTVAVPVCVLVGEVLARSVRRFDDSRELLRHRVELVQRLAEASSELGRDLSEAAVFQGAVTAALSVLPARGAVFWCVVEDEIVVVATAGRAPLTVGSRRTLAGSELERAAGSDRAVVRGRQVTVACGRQPLLGGLTVELDGQGGRPVELEADLLRLLAAQAAAALLNARRHADALRQRQHEQEVVDVLADGVLVLAPDGTVAAANAAAGQLLGRTVAQLLSRPAPLEVGAPGTTLEQRTGAGRWVEARSALLPTTGELVVALHDVSRQRALDEAKDLFLATTSHELRTPLTAIKGYVRTLQRRWDALGEQARREVVATVAERTDALVELTEHLLMGARAGAGAHAGPPVAFDLCPVVRTAVAAYGGAGTHRIRAQLPERLPVRGDPVGTATALGQLLENAVKYSPAAGEITVTARADAGRAVLEVRDNGAGIPPGEEQVVFTPFYQAGRPNTRQYGGVGLGLYIVRQLVEAQGGTVSAGSHPGGGALLRITLPLAEVPVGAGP